MSKELNAFFAKVTADPDLQMQLNMTNEVAEVADIARGLGFKIIGAQILRAQAGRVLMLPLDELETVASGEKAKTGAQWGRGGNGYLDNAGFWVNELMHWGYTDSANEPQLETFLARVKNDDGLQSELLLARTCKDVAILANKYGYEVSGSLVLRYQAIQILKLSDEEADKVASGAS
ncbi:MAG: Nif11-like leader peptide family natural product precursor [Parachlamydiaceae bacterium]|nr:Nif11-like leader peptide family natural product precursor [Parachlamydiaceae bacterium]